MRYATTAKTNKTESITLHFDEPFVEIHATPREASNDISDRAGGDDSTNRLSTTPQISLTGDDDRAVNRDMTQLFEHIVICRVIWLCGLQVGVIRPEDLLLQGYCLSVIPVGANYIYYTIYSASGGAPC